MRYASLCRSQLAAAPDIVGRAIAQKLQDKFGQPFVVGECTGAGGSIGANQVAKACARRLYAVAGIIIGDWHNIRR